MKVFLKIAKIFGITIAAIVLLLFVIYLFLPKQPDEIMAFDDPWHVNRPVAHANTFMASTGTPWATRAALDVMSRGGNAVDAAVAALLALNVTNGQEASFPGVAPVLVYDAKTGKVWGYTGAGTAPKKATIELFTSQGYETIPSLNIWAQLIPASPDVIFALLKRYGTKSFGELSSYAIKLAEEGFPATALMVRDLDMNIIERFAYYILMPYNVQVYLKGQWWRPLSHKEKFTRPDLAKTFRAMAAAEKRALDETGSREKGLIAARNCFYKGPLAERIVAFHEREGGLFTKEDLSNYSGYWEKPITGRFAEYTICSNDTWCQGPVVPLALQILDGIDLESMGHNTPEYLHTVIQAIELAIADREAYFGDPKFVKVPIKELLDQSYAAERRKAMTPGKAFPGMPAAGKPENERGALRVPVSEDKGALALNDFNFGRDTSYLTVIDGRGNAVSLTPSDFPLSPMVPGTGMTLGIRMVQFRLDPDHPTALQPGKRPRITPNPSMVLKNGKLFMSFGTPGGDFQPQGIIQVFLNIVVFGMDPQEAINAPRFRSQNFPDSFAPHTSYPSQVLLEKKLYDSVGTHLAALGYDVVEKEDWDGSTFGAVCAIIRDQKTGKLIGGADPRQESWAEGR